MKTTVAFLGLGVMGAGMAARLLGAGFAVQAWNRNRERAEPLRAQGAGVASSPREAASGAGVIVSMVADDTASRAVWTGVDGALAGAAPDAVAIECSTLSPVWVTELAGFAAEAGCAFLDAPVTGSRVQAAGGELLFLAGGDADALERARPVLRVMGRDVVHMGPVASGARMKLINNFVAAVQAVALGEALAFSEASGLDRVAAMSVLSNGAPGSPLVKTVGARIMSADYRVNFEMRLMRKDVQYASDEARRHGVELRTAACAARAFDAAIEAGWGHADFAAVAEDLAGRRPPAV